MGFSWSNKPSNGFRCWKKEKERGLCWSKSSLARSEEVYSYILFLSLVTNLITECSRVSFLTPRLFVASFSFLYHPHFLISVIFTRFLLSSYLLKLLVFLYFFWFYFIFICALKEWEDFLIYKGFTCKVGLGQLNQVNLHPARHEFKRRPTQLNSSPTGARNQRKFAPNPSPIRIRIPACTSVSIFGMTFCSDIQSRWFKLGWKFNLTGYNFVVYQKSELWR